MGNFLQIGDLPISLIWINSEIYQQFPVQNPNLKGVSSMKEIVHISILGPILWAVLTNEEFSNWPTLAQFENYSTIYCRKSPHNYLGPHNVDCFEK